RSASGLTPRGASPALPCILIIFSPLEPAVYAKFTVLRPKSAQRGRIQAGPLPALWQSPGMSVLNTLPIVIFSAAMIFAAVRDLTTMTIPNWLTLGLTIAFFISAVSLGMPLADIARHASAGFALLLIGMGLFARG